MDKLVIGLDFGSDSARALLVRCSDGAILHSCAKNYPRWAEGRFCDPKKEQYRQSPEDYAEVLQYLLTTVAANKPGNGRIVGIGVDSTSSTPCILGADMKPLSDEDPDAMFVLWKDHTAVGEAAEITASLSGYLSHCGGVYSAENCWSKVLHILRTNPSIAERAEYVMEQCDYIPFLLTGVWKPSRCAAALKQLWDSSNGFPPASEFGKLHPKMAHLLGNIPSENYCSYNICGCISKHWAKLTGIGEDIVVSVGNIDAHSGAVGAGCSAGTMVMNLGTSACIMAVGEHTDTVPGVFGQAPDTIMPGLIGFEMGLSSFGDNFAWASRLTGKSMEELTFQAQQIQPQKDLPLCTDWFNGRRTPDPDSAKCASILNLKLSTTPAEIFRGILEGSCFGIKTIVEHLWNYGIRPERIVAIGGIPYKSPFLMQMLSCVLAREVEVSGTKESCALGAAMNAAVAAGVFNDLISAQSSMVQPIARKYTPSGASYDGRYAEYMKLYL